MIRKYVCYIDVESNTGEVNIEGLEKAPTVDYLSIGSELISQYENYIRDYINVCLKEDV